MLVLQLAAQGLSLVPADLRLTPHLSRGPHSEVQQCGRLIIWEGTTPPFQHNESYNSSSKTGPSVAGTGSAQNEHGRAMKGCRSAASRRRGLRRGLLGNIRQNDAEKWPEQRRGSGMKVPGGWLGSWLEKVRSWEIREALREAAAPPCQEAEPVEVGQRGRLPEEASMTTQIIRVGHKTAGFSALFFFKLKFTLFSSVN